VTGTSLIDCSRRCAVTVICSICTVGSAGGASSAAETAPIHAPSAQAISRFLSNPLRPVLFVDEEDTEARRDQPIIF